MSEMQKNQIFVAGYSKSRFQEKADIKELFHELGAIREVVYKGSFAFVVKSIILIIWYDFKTFESEQDAEKACRDFNGKPIHGQKLKVELVDNRGGGRKRDASENDECFQCGEKGHWARDCKNRSNTRGRRKRSSSYSRY